MYEASNATRSPGAPIDGSRRFQLVTVASGTVIDGRLHDETGFSQVVARAKWKAGDVDAPFVVALVVIPDAVALAADFRRASRQQMLRLNDRGVCLTVDVVDVPAERAVVRANMFGRGPMARLARDPEFRRCRLGGLRVAQV